MKASAAVKSMRLRTLPLSTAGVLLGMALAISNYRVDPLVAVLLLLTTVCLQILSNLSNELGDVLSGTDTGERQGPSYGLNDGELTIGDMKKLIGVFVALCALFGTLMTLRAFGTLWDITPILILLLGAGAITAAMKYTLGRNPYGYRAKGDFYVFIFFGLVSVAGAYFVCSAGGMNLKILLPAAAVGFFSVGVLNVNNIRDMETDAATRLTIAIKLGEKRAKIYQSVLIGLGWACMIAFNFLCWPDWRHWLFAITLPLYLIHIRGVWQRTGKDLDPMLPLLVMSTFLFCILAGLGYCLFL